MKANCFRVKKNKVSLNCKPLMIILLKTEQCGLNGLQLDDEDRLLVKTLTQGRLMWHLGCCGAKASAIQLYCKCYTRTANVPFFILF